MQTHIIYSNILHPIQSQAINLKDLDESLLGQWVKLEQVQFAAAETGKTFSGEAFDEFDGERRLVQCNDQRSIFMSTSTFADYKSLLLPHQSGSIEGVLTLDYYGEHYRIKINDPSNLNMTAPRCDPYFEESFDHIRLGLFDATNWTNFKQEGSKQWEVYEDAYSLGQSIRMGSYRSGDATTISWLISPKIDPTPLNHPHLAFRTSTSFADNSVLEVFYSTNWTGDISQLQSAQWLPLPARIANKTDNASHWIDSGDIPLTFGTPFYIAFRYTGSGKSSYDGTYELDDIRVFEKATE